MSDRALPPSVRRIPERARTEGPFSPVFHDAAELVGRRWTAAILFAIAHGIHRFSDLQAAIPGLSARLLTERLRELEHRRILQRVRQTGSRRLTYELTPKGNALRPVLMDLNHWAVTWADGGVDE